jgi:hypothetical protein
VIVVSACSGPFDAGFSRASKLAMKLTMLTTDQKIAEIRRLYFCTTRRSIQQDFEKALDLLKSIASEDDRERATVYMEGMAQMRRDWAGSQRRKATGKKQK